MATAELWVSALPCLNDSSIFDIFGLFSKKHKTNTNAAIFTLKSKTSCQIIFEYVKEIFTYFCYLNFLIYPYEFFIQYNISFIMSESRTPKSDGFVIGIYPYVLKRCDQDQVPIKMSNKNISFTVSTKSLQDFEWRVLKSIL